VLSGSIICARPPIFVTGSRIAIPPDIFGNTYSIDSEAQKKGSRMSEIIKVGMADLKTCVSPDGVTTLGLGFNIGNQNKISVDLNFVIKLRLYQQNLVSQCSEFNGWNTENSSCHIQCQRQQEGFSEIEFSAMQEIGNIITGAYLNSLSMMTNLTIIPTPPSLTLDMAGGIFIVPPP